MQPLPTAIARFLGTHDSFAFHLSRHAGPDLDAGLKRFRVIISPIIKNWSVTQNRTFAGTVLRSGMPLLRAGFRA